MCIVKLLIYGQRSASREVASSSVLRACVEIINKIHRIDNKESIVEERRGEHVHVPFL